MNASGTELLCFVFASLSLHAILSARFGFRLPLHVRGRISTAAFQCLDVINDVPRAATRNPAGGWAWMRALKGSCRVLAALDFAVMVARAPSALVAANLLRTLFSWRV
jgi:hypothetical protein